MPLRILTIVFLFLSLTMASCSEKITPEEEIRNYIKVAEEAAEKKELGTLKKLIADTYLDEKKRSKKDIQRIMAGYFFRNSTIYLLTRVDTIQIISENKAEVLIYVAMASTQLPDSSVLLDIHADLHRMDLVLVKLNGRWLLQRSEWRKALLDDFLSE